jgi:predicted molibdopterin-dependent oxidoreductase YjgC
MFRRLPDAGEATLPFTIDGAPAMGRQGDSVAAALLAAGHPVFRQSAVTGSDRGPYCMMGVCFDCLVEIDGVGNRQGCMTLLRAGMAIRPQPGKRLLGR